MRERSARICWISLVFLGCDDGGEAGADASLEADATPTLEHHALGTVQLVDGRATLTLDLPADVRTLDLVLVEPVERHLLAVTGLRGPSGVWVEAEPPGWTPSDADFLLGPFPGAFHSPNRSVPIGAGVGALHAPNAPGLALAGGTWWVEVGAVDFDTEAPGAGPIEVTAFVQRGPPRATGRLPIHLFFSDSSGLSAETAALDEDFQATLGRLAADFSLAGITLEVATWQDVAAPADIATEGGPGSDLHALLRQNPYDTGVAVFLVHRLVTPFGTDLAGVAGGTPGPALTPGTGRSGVAIALGTDLSPEALGRAMAHEIAHFLGLFHTVEGPFEDPLPDTPTDDPQNLLAPAATDAPTHLSPTQAALLRDHPAVEP